MGKERILIGLVCVVSTVFIWSVFSLGWGDLWKTTNVNKGMSQVLANFDGPLYVVVAKSWYNFEQGYRFEFDLPKEYFAAHFPLYPAVLWAIDRVTGIGMPWASVLATLLGSLIFSISFYAWVSRYVEKKKAVLIAIAALFLPARYLVVRSVASPEPWFVWMIFMSLTAFADKKYWRAGIFGGMAVLTKSPGILLFVAYIISAIWQYKKVKKIFTFLPVLLIPGALLALFGIYAIQMGDFWAYFNSGDNIHLELLPFGVFNANKPWVGTWWLEDVIWVYLVGLVGIVGLWRQKHTELAIFVGVFLASIVFVSHRDISRYALPIMPMVLFAILRNMDTKLLKFVLAGIVPPVIVYAINFIANNAISISDWSRLM